MQNTVARYILFFFFAVFTGNTVTTMLEKKSDSNVLCMQSEGDQSDADDKPVKDPNQKKFQFNPNTLPFDDDICHEFQFSNYYVHIKQVKYQASVFSLLDAAVSDLYSPPRI